MKKPVNPAALAQVAHQTRSLLAFHQEIGLTDYPTTPGLVTFLSARQPVAAPHPVAVPRQKNVSKPAAPEPVRISSESIQPQLERISQELSNCQSCPETTEQTIKIPGSGTPRPRLLIIGDACIGTPRDANVIWSREEDELFLKMMAAIGLTWESIYVTKVVKCCQPTPLNPDAEAAQRCLSFLERELTAIQCPLICTMGEVAPRLILKTQAPMIRLRKRFHQYRYPHGNTARVLVTFPPALLLQHEELKKGAWEDLQALQRQMESGNNGNNGNNGN